jgi:hypothetical protein
MKLHLVTITLALLVSACVANNTRSSPPRPQVDYMNETSPMACMIEQDPVKRATCIAIVRRNVAHCAPIANEAQRTFCIEAVKQRLQK